MSLTRFTFGMCVNNLKLFCSNFRITDEQIEAWYEKLKHFTDLQLKLATDRLCKESEKTVTFQMLYAFAKNSTGTFRAQPIVIESEIQGAAYPSDEKFKMQAYYMRELGELLKIKDKREREDFAEVLKTSWIAEFRKLPGYVSVEEVRELIKNEDVAALKELGLLNPLWKKDQTRSKLFGEVL